MYERIKKEIKQNYYQQNFPNDGQRFVAWYLRNIYLRNMNETKDDITDGADDKQIDAIVIDDDKQTIFVIQGKFIGSSSVDAEPLREVLSSWLQLRDIIKLQEVGNIKLKRKLSEVAKALEDDYEVAFELITTSTLTESANNDLATFQKQLADLAEKEDFPSSITVIDKDELNRRYDLALERESPSIKHTIDLSDSRFLPLNIAGTQVVVAAIPLRECINIPGIKDGTLFQKNVRQSLGLNNAVNKGIKNTIYSDKHRDFFFFHNGITAICNKLELQDQKLKLNGLSVVNGCQSLNTIISCSERIKTLDDTFVLFRFYEIPQRERADRISINTNSQSAVKPRDLRSNDKRVLNLKKLFEQKYPSGYFITKRGEQAPADKDKNYVLDLSDLGKYLIAWHSKRPNVSYSEAKIFDKYFEQLFKREYKPENAQALNFWMKELLKSWTDENSLGMNETLLAMKAYAPYHHLYAISMCFAISNNESDRVPNPGRCLEKAQQNGMVDEIINISGRSVNMALEAAANEVQPQGKIFSPHNWIKAKTCLAGINFAIHNYFSMLPMLPGGQELSKRLKEILALGNEDFEYRWEAD
ncbi:MAG TPA: AIPR protein [Bacteroidales bacterium]|nr:AIPR protein [Bacteroidales bacterium]HBQ28221.1 AIPR protein [Desulfotomaculum sp.]